MGALQLKLVLTALLLAAAPACSGTGPVARIHTTGGPVDVALEVAATPETQQRGLMYRSALADDHGMLFVFPIDSEHEFWMKNTLISLDMLFVAADGRIVGIHADATPLSTAPITVGTPSRWVIEVPGGFARKNGLAAGDRVELAGVRLP